MAEGDIWSQWTSFDVEGGILSFINWFVPLLLYIIPAALVLLYIVSFYRNKKIFKYPCRVARRRSNGDSVEVNMRGGYIKNKQGLITFRIKTGKLPWQKQDLHYLPDTALMEKGTNRLYFNQLDPQTFVQTKAVWLQQPILRYEVEFLKDYQGFNTGDKTYVSAGQSFEMQRSGLIQLTGNQDNEIVDTVYFEPVPRDLKAMAIQEVKAYSDTLQVDTTKQLAIVAGSILAIFLFGMVAFYFLTNR